MDHDAFAREVAALAESLGHGAAFAACCAYSTQYMIVAPDGTRLRVTVEQCPPRTVRRADPRPLGTVLADWPEHGCGEVAL